MHIMKKHFIVVYPVLFFVLLFAYMMAESRWIKTTTYQISSSDLPPAFDNKKIVFISDIHHGPFLDIHRVEKLVRKINVIQPDMIALGGDYVHRDKKFIVPVFDAFKGLHAPLGVFGVLGNHDHWEGTMATKNQFKKCGFTLCDNTSLWIKCARDSIKIGGVGDLWEDTQIVKNTTHNVQKSDFAILISHNPDFLEEIGDAPLDLILCGHTHGGQVTFFGLWAPLLPSRFGQKYRYGRQKSNNVDVIITSGVGTITPPLRFFCRPEVVVIRLKRLNPSFQ